MQDIDSTPDKQDKAEKLMKLAKLVSDLSKNKIQESEIKKSMIEAGLKYSADPMARIDLVMRELDFLED